MDVSKDDDVIKLDVDLDSDEMKSESESTTPASAATPPVATTTTQWSNAQIPIDPALQQQSQHATTAYQHYQGYASHYPQAAYPAHYQPYAPPVTAQQNTQRQTTAGGNSTANNVDTSDVATLNDALGSAGVDLRAEEESLQRTHDHQSFRVYDDRSKKQPNTPSFDVRFLGQTMRTIGTSHKVTRVPDDAINYLALALRARLQDLVTSMIAATHHRTSTQFDRPASLYTDNQPMWSIVVRSDVAKQLAAMEKAEREEETRIRRERKERAELAAAHAAALAAQANCCWSSVRSGVRRRRRRRGKEETEERRTGPTQAAGLGGRYAWMNAANLNAPIPPKPKPAQSATSSSTMAAATTHGQRRTFPTKPKAAPPPQEEDNRLAITMRDAMFVIEKERGHGGGKGAARGWV
ncbi:transcription initiation factor TFIID component TAF4 family-domain-containing protein [Amanita rubescens]|nr:transcription initiation factor TFIID component TAF4 family-domain-containing protein [Amanita rubescens]